MKDTEVSESNQLPAKRAAHRPRIAPGVQDPGPRGRVLLERYGIDQIRHWYKLVLSDQGEKIPLSTPDMLLLGRIARAFTDDNALDKLYDRSFGKVPDKTINLNLNVDVDPVKLGADASEMLAMLED